MKIYVVLGQTGEYSDNRYWLVKAFHQLFSAENYALIAKRRADELVKSRAEPWMKIKEGSNEFDPDMDEDPYFDDVRYSVLEVDCADCKAV